MSKYDGRPDQIVFITGMHRSGASFLAHALSLCGLDMGKNHDGSDWEDRDFVRMNDAILAEAGADWAHPKQVKGDLYGDEREAFEMFTEKRIGFKDPRLCWTFPVWSLFWEDIQSVSVIASIRHPAEVAASLAESANIEEKDALKLWTDAYALLQEYGTKFVSFPDMGGLKEAIKYVGLEWNPEVELSFREELVNHQEPDWNPDIEPDSLGLYEDIKEQIHGSTNTQHV